MSRLRARVSLGVALLFLMPTPQAAQTAPASNAQQDLLLEIDSLIEQAQQAEERLRRTQEHHLAVTREVDATTLDTVTVASLRIVTPPDQVELATELFSEVMSEEFPGVERHDAFDGAWFPFQWKAQLESIVVVGSPYPVENLRGVSREDVKAQISRKVRAALTSHVLGTESGLAGWRVVNDFQPPKEWYARVYREVATMPAQVARSCLEKEAAACWSLLGLELGPSPVRLWYTPAERQALVVRRERFFGRPHADLLMRCTDQGSTEACDELIDGLRPYFREPSSNRARTVMLSLALQAGGVGAWARLLEAQAMPPGDALRHISGLSTDELSSQWREVILAARPNVHAGFGLTQLATALWILLLVALAMRSTRWRLG